MAQRACETSCTYDHKSMTLTLEMKGLPPEYANFYSVNLHQAIEQITLAIPRADLTPTQWGETKENKKS